jgi:hypothetical protein
VSWASTEGGGEVGELRKGFRARVEMASSSSTAVYWVASCYRWWDSALSIRLLDTLLQCMLGNRPAAVG